MAKARLRKILELAFGLAGLAITGGSVSVAASPPSETLSACPADTLLNAPIAQRLRELVLQPGRKIDPAALFKDQDTAKFIARITQQEHEQQLRDWPALCRYRYYDRTLAGQRPDVVFLGDSITDNWQYGEPAWFSAKRVNRGISGQTSAQILVRFYPDVVALQPRAVVILAGTNDLLHGYGIVTDDDTLGNVSAMLDIAQAHHIRAVIASILPFGASVTPAPERTDSHIRALNERLRALAMSRHAGFADYYAALTDGRNGIRADLSNDGIHPNRSGYAAMRPVVERALAETLSR